MRNGEALKGSAAAAFWMDTLAGFLMERRDQRVTVINGIPVKVDDVAKASAELCGWFADKLAADSAFDCHVEGQRFRDIARPGHWVKGRNW
jgi:hypothetical protein